MQRPTERAWHTAYRGAAWSWRLLRCSAPSAYDSSSACFGDAGSRKVRLEKQLDEIEIQQHLPGQDAGVLKNLRHDDAAVDESIGHVGKLAYVDRHARRIALGDLLQAIAKPLAPAVHADAGQL